MFADHDQIPTSFHLFGVSTWEILWLARRSVWPMPRAIDVASARWGDVRPSARWWDHGWAMTFTPGWAEHVDPTSGNPLLGAKMEGLEIPDPVAHGG